MNLEQAIKDFHKKFDLEYTGGPRELPDELRNFRTNFLMEELNEYIDAQNQGDLEKQFDALIDLVYIAIGNAYLQGFPFNAGFELVQIANMAKVRALKESDSTRGSTYDVVKPEGWVAPDLSPLLAVA